MIYLNIKNTKGEAESIPFLPFVYLLCKKGDEWHRIHHNHMYLVRRSGPHPTLKSSM